MTDLNPFDRALSVSDITAQVKAVLEASLPDCWVTGEVSDFRRPSSGHCYLTLKDESCQLSCVMFRFQAQQIAFTPEPGMQVLVYGRISVYDRGGKYQFYVSRMQPAGIGEMALAFEQLKNRLEMEGLFDAERKRRLPAFPRTIGIVTSQSGAAVRDIIQVLGRRAPGIQLTLRPTPVQGVGAAEQIAQAIDDLNRHSEADLLIVGRGGGSPEDLWPFNEEVVARAIYASKVPTVSAVGHEIDTTIADYVADVRAPTPSAAAEMVAQEYGVLHQGVASHGQRLRTAMRVRLDHLQQQLDNSDPQRLATRLRDRLEQATQFTDEVRQQLVGALDASMLSRLESFRTAALRLHALDPLAGLARGFAFCEHEEGGHPVRSGHDLHLGEYLRLRFGEGSARCRVEEIDHEQVDH